jgi:hypothetical protein
MTEGYGVTESGFVVKGIDVLLAAVLADATDVLGPGTDLTSTSAVRKLLETGSLEYGEIWKALEQQYYATYLSTASGDALDLLGDDAGFTRLTEFATGTVTLTLGNGVAGRSYLLEDALLVTSSAPPLAFTLDDSVTLTSDRPTATVGVTCTARGFTGNVAAAAIDAIDPAWLAAMSGDLGAATLTVTNPDPLTGGGTPEPDNDYRGRQIGASRTLWTPDAVLRAVGSVDGVVDVLISDPLGGVDVAQSYFNQFDFGTRLFSAERRVGEPYRFDVVVAHEYRWPWETSGIQVGVYDRVSAAVDLVRPPGIHPNIIEADHIDVGVRATVVIEPAYDAAALLARIEDRIAAGIAALKLGSDVLASQVMKAFTDEPGVVDVRSLHLRRGPAAFGRITLGGVHFQAATVEAAVGENLAMDPTELAVFLADSPLNDLAAVTS